MPSDAELQAALSELESPGDDGVRTFVFEKGDEVPAGHPAVLAFPHLFDPARESD